MKNFFSRNIFIIIFAFIFIDRVAIGADKQTKKIVKSKATTLNKTTKQQINNKKEEKKKSDTKKAQTIKEIIDNLEKTLPKFEKDDDSEEEMIIKNKEDEILETYAGMVGDKRASNGIMLDLTMETRGVGRWLLCVNGKNIENEKLVTSDLQQSTSRFLIDVNTDLLNDKVVNFTYQMPRDIRLRYGKQKKGYRIIIDMPNNTKIVTKKVSKGEISVKFVNYDIITLNEELKKKKKKQDLSSIKDEKKTIATDDSNKSSSDVIFDSKRNGLREIEGDTIFEKIKIKHKKPLVVAIDAGHGGIDPGAKSTKGFYEKDITLKYAKSLQAELKKRNIRVVMIRTNDKTVPLTNRVKIAKQSNADLFISLHTDAHVNPKISGTTVYRLSDLNDSHPDWKRFYNKHYLPKKYENYVNNYNILDMLLSMTHQTLSRKSSIIMDNVLLSFKKNGICKICRKGQRSFAVLRGLNMISILIEIGYISNPKEEKKLLLASNIKKFSVELANVIAKTFE